MVLMRGRDKVARRVEGWCDYFFLGAALSSSTTERPGCVAMSAAREVGVDGGRRAKPGKFKIQKRQVFGRTGRQALLQLLRLLGVVDGEGVEVP